MTENLKKIIQLLLTPVKFALDIYLRWFRVRRERSWEDYNGIPIKMKSGARLALNPDCAYSQVLFARRVSGLAEINLARHIITPGDMAIDVGANVGYVTTSLSQLIGPKGKVLAFEPSPTTYDYLIRNLHINACDNVLAYQVALSDKEESGLLYESARTSGDNRMYMPQRDQLEKTDRRRAIRVQTKKLDDYASQLDLARLSALKIDAQGYECRILEGAANLIDQCPKLTISVEFTPNFLEEVETSPESLWNLTQQLNLKMSLLKETPRPGPRILLQPMDHSDFQQLTYQLQKTRGPSAFEMLVLSKELICV